MKYYGLLFNPPSLLYIIYYYSIISPNNKSALCSQPGQELYEKDCGTKCICKPDKGLVCEEHSCPPNTKCMVKKGIRACYNTGKIKKQLILTILKLLTAFSNFPIDVPPLFALCRSLQSCQLSGQGEVSRYEG